MASKNINFLHLLHAPYALLHPPLPLYPLPVLRETANIKGEPKKIGFRITPVGGSAYRLIQRLGFSGGKGVKEKSSFHIPFTCSGSGGKVSLDTTIRTTRRYLADHITVSRGLNHGILGTQSWYDLIPETV